MTIQVACRAAIFLGLAATACGSDEMAGPPPPTRTIQVTPDRLVLGAGMSRRLSATVLDETGTSLPGATVSFESSDPSRVEVSVDGLASYRGAGEAEIRARSEDQLLSVPYTGLSVGHPLGAMTTSTRLPGDEHGSAPFGVAIDAEGRIFISQADSGRLAAGLYPDTGFTSRELGGRPTSIALLGGGTALVTPTGSDDSEASVVELTSEIVLARIPLGVTANSVVTSPDSETAYLGTTDGRVLELDVASARVIRSIDLGVEHSRANHLAINAAGTLLYASSFTTGTISEIDVASHSVVRVFFVGGEPQGLAISPNGTDLYVANESGNGHIDVYDLAAEVQVASIPSGATTSLGGPFGLAMSPDGTAVYVGVITTEGPGLIQIIDAATRSIQRTINSCGSSPRRIAFGFSGGLAVIADESGCATFVE